MFEPDFPDTDPDAWDGMSLYRGAIARGGGCETCSTNPVGRVVTDDIEADDVMQLILRLIGDLDGRKQQVVLDRLSQLVLPDSDAGKILGSGEEIGEIGDAEAVAAMDGVVGVAELTEPSEPEETTFEIASDEAILGGAAGLDREEVVNFAVDDEAAEVNVGAEVSGGAETQRKTVQNRTFVAEDASSKSAESILNNFAFVVDEYAPTDDFTPSMSTDENPYNATFGEWVDVDDPTASLAAINDALMLV